MRRDREGVAPWEFAGYVSFKVPEDVKPPGSWEDVIIAAHLKVVICGHGVVDPPKPTCDEVGEQHINTIVAPCHHQGADAHQADQKRDPV